MTSTTKKTRKQEVSNDKLWEALEAQAEKDERLGKQNRPILLIATGVGRDGAIDLARAHGCNLTNKKFKKLKKQLTAVESALQRLDETKFYITDALPRA